MNNFDPDAYQAFQEAMAERYDFKTCSRNDGTTYGIPNDAKCTKGKEGGSKKKKSTEIAMTPEEINQGLIEASKAITARDRANPGPLRSRTPITPTREMMGWTIKQA